MYWNKLWVLFVLFIQVPICTGTTKHTNVVIVGGLGDLARKYLWKSGLQLFVENHNHGNTFSFIAAARMSQTEGEEEFNKLLEKIQCDEDEKCHKLRSMFVKSSSYVQLKTAENYTNLCKNFQKRKQDHPKATIRQIFYLSLPPSAYESVAKSIQENCRFDGLALQVVLEKPFGADKNSALHQIDLLQQYFSDEETYRTDHYLAKTVTKQILPFRNANKEHLEPLLNNKVVDRVEVVMKETIGVKGRIDFYDQNGVIRDVMQNHLTELLALVAMELPANISDSQLIEHEKLAILQSVRTVSKHRLLIGQYSNYLTEAGEELDNIVQSYYTPTFAASLLHIDNSRWQDVPFVLMSGKHMDERSSYIRVIFREHEFCVSGCASGNSSMTKYPRQLIFQIGHGAMPSPGVLVSKSLFSPDWPIGLKQLSMTSKDSLVHGQNPGDFYYAVPISKREAYETVLSDIYHQVRETFVTSARVMLLWDIWDKVLQDTKSSLPRVYREADASILNFKVDKYQLHFIKEGIKHSIYLGNEQLDQVYTIPKLFRNSSLICLKKSELIHSLANHLFHVAQHSIKQHNIFHVAFSGGTTPMSLFQELASNFPSFPWASTHIWQVDERCVSHKHRESNFLMLHEHLLKHIKIPYFNIHPMPVNYAGAVCDPKSKGDLLYEELITHLLPAHTFDLILLGLGSDGHTASIFPNSEALKETSKLVGLTKSRRDGHFDRMSVLLPVINHAREITFLVSGAEKHNILHEIADVELPSSQVPATMVAPVMGNVTWFVDTDAWLGKVMD